MNARLHQCKAACEGCMNAMLHEGNAAGMKGSMHECRAARKQGSMNTRLQ
jgi:hypothetical protein